MQRLTFVFLILLLACDGTSRRNQNSPGPGPGNPDGGTQIAACRLVGDLIDLGPDVDPYVVTAPEGILLIAGPPDAPVSHLVTTSTVGAPVALGLGLDTVVGGGLGGALAASIPNSVFLDGVSLRAWNGTGWEMPDNGAPVALGPSGLVGSRNLALASDGTATLFWSLGLDPVLNLVGFSPQIGFGSLQPLDGAPFEGRELHVAYGPDDTLHVLMAGDGGDGIDLFYLERTPDRQWQPNLRVGPAPGSLGNLVVSGLAVTGTTAYIAEVHAASLDEDGMMTLYAVTGDATRIGEIVDPRLVAGGLAAASLPDGVVVSVAYGENNLDAPMSQDTVELHRCTLDGCDRALVVRDARGHFYERTSVATNGNFGVVTWAERPKGGSRGCRSNRRPAFHLRLTAPYPNQPNPSTVSGGSPSKSLSAHALSSSNEAASSRASTSLDIRNRDGASKTFE